ncbi:ATP synthase complex subunit h domain-containing protein [Rhizoctonia solani AG-1 IA]|uniref:ATP synthase complex subunit h domain-containing protein n=1 Tax=Thanatephorus cucumeris (strain AG1-IA) TaxID=983506 RepID=L8X583_THACA|nr:ATP synthase complex subunit h domain-containing protein [Rhizoctonia solani AG-1 IA]
MSSIARQSFMCRRARFSTSAVARKDLVQDLYLRELKAYKAPVKAKDAHVGVVKSYTAPSAPTAPLAPTDLASELSRYDETEPTLADAPAASPSIAAQAQGDVGSADAFLSFLEQDVPKTEAHH